MTELAMRLEARRREYLPLVELTPEACRRLGDAELESERLRLTAEASGMALCPLRLALRESAWNCRRKQRERERRRLAAREEAVRARRRAAREEDERKARRLAELVEWTMSAPAHEVSDALARLRAARERQANRRRRCLARRRAVSPEPEEFHPPAVVMRVIPVPPAGFLPGAMRLDAESGEPRGWDGLDPCGSFWMGVGFRCACCLHAQGPHTVFGYAEREDGRLAPVCDQCLTVLALANACGRAAPFEEGWLAEGRRQPNIVAKIQRAVIVTDLEGGFPRLAELVGWAMSAPAHEVRDAVGRLSGRRVVSSALAVARSRGRDPHDLAEAVTISQLAALDILPRRRK